jgi:hypothetical protein
MSRRHRDLGRRLDAIEGKGEEEIPMAMLHLPENGRDVPLPANRRRSVVVHEIGCGFPRWRCPGPPSCPSVPPIAELTDAELAARLGDLEHLRLTYPSAGTTFQARMSELETLTTERASRNARAGEGHHA